MCLLAKQYKLILMKQGTDAPETWTGAFTFSLASGSGGVQVKMVVDSIVMVRQHGHHSLDHVVDVI
jgi:hypothetical protein